MQPSTRDTAKGFAAAIAATGFVIALILSAPADARHGGDNFGRPSATPTYDAWLEGGVRDAEAEIAVAVAEMTRRSAA